MTYKGILQPVNALEPNFVHTLHTFHVQKEQLKVVGNEKRGGSGSKLLIEYGFGPWRSMSV